RSGERPRQVVTELAGPAPLPPVPTSDTSRDELLRRDEAQRGQIVALRDKVRELEAEIERAEKEGRKDKQANFVDPTKEELLEIVKRCRLEWDMPTVELEPHKYGDGLSDELGLSADEKEAITRMHQAYNDRMLAQIREMYVAATGDKNGAS